MWNFKDGCLMRLADSFRVEGDGRFTVDGYLLVISCDAKFSVGGISVHMFFGKIYGTRSPEMLVITCVLFVATLRVSLQALYVCYVSQG